MTAGKLSSKSSQAEADERLLVSAAQADPSSFAELYERNFEPVYAFIMRRVGNRSEAEDLTAEVFHKALANLSRFKWRGAPFAAWLFRIAANTIADGAKQSARARKFSNSNHDTGTTEQQPELEFVEHRARLYKLVRALPEAQQCVIQMRFGEEKSIQEIAEQLGRSEGAIKQLQFRALKNLRAGLQ